MKKNMLYNMTSILFCSKALRAISLHVSATRRSHIVFLRKYCGLKPDSTVQYSTVQYDTVQYGTGQSSPVQHSTLQYSTVRYGTVQYSTIQYNTVQQYSAINHGRNQRSGGKES